MKIVAEERLDLHLKNQLPELARLNQALSEFGQRHHVAREVVLDMNLALAEVVTNIISYGFNDTNDHTIQVSVSLSREKLQAEVADDGQPFNPLEAPSPDTKQPLEERSEGGLGIHLVRALMDEVVYQRGPAGNVLVMRKLAKR